jgi:hypothetical protein
MRLRSDEESAADVGPDAAQIAYDSTRLLTRADASTFTSP